MLFLNIKRRKVIALLFCLLFLFETNLIAVTRIPTPPYTKSQIQTWLAKGWAGYKMNFISTSGQVLRPENNNDTVSEGQAYAMLLAVNMNDKVTFDKCFTWTEQNLSRLLPGSALYGGPDNLLAWHWVPVGGVQADGWNAASDADGDYAYALLLAYEKWGQQNYLNKAIAVLNDILAKEIHTPAFQTNVIYLKPGNWGESNIYGHQGIFINPSYFSPAWYRKFNTYLPDARWQMLIDGCYQFINTAKTTILNPATNISLNGVGLLPDWAFVDEYGVVYFEDNSDNNISLTISGWDAFRLPWRIYEDYRLYSEARAKSWLDIIASFYQSQFNAGQQIFATYYYTGSPAVNYTSPAASGIPLLDSNFKPQIALSQQTATAQTALAYILKSAPTNPPVNNQFSGADTFQEFPKYGYFIAPGDILRYYINSWGMFGLLTASQAP